MCYSKQVQKHTHEQHPPALDCSNFIDIIHNSVRQHSSKHASSRCTRKEDTSSEDQLRSGVPSRQAVDAAREDARFGYKKSESEYSYECEIASTERTCSEYEPDGEQLAIILHVSSRQGYDTEGNGAAR